MDPPDGYIFPADYVCWLYRFYVAGEEAFLQHGSPEDSIVYWLDVQARPHDMDALFGWKTSIDHWNDDAVWGLGLEPYYGPWYELRYPPNHQWAGVSIDLAFRLFNDPESAAPADPRGREQSLRLYQNAPNPFGSATTVRYDLPVREHVRLEVYDVTGRLVSTLVDRVEEAGSHDVAWSGLDHAGRRVPAGIYFCTLSAGSDRVTRKLLYLK